MSKFDLCIYRYNSPSEPLPPTHSALGTLHIECSIYNWKQLCTKYNIEANSDSEFIFNYLESNLDIKNLINELDGEYACVYCKKNENKIYLFRDSLGNFPLFYSLNPLIFSFERKENLIELHPRTLLIYNIETKKTKTEYYDFFNKIKKNTNYNEINNLLSSSVEKRMLNEKPLILFSGGIDSQYLALKSRELGYEPTLLTSFSEGGEDIKYSRNFCNEHSFKLKEIEFTKNMLKEDIENIMMIISSCDSVKVGISIPLYYASSLSKNYNGKNLFCGAGADEIFGGYHRFKEVKEIQNELISSLKNIYERDTYRNYSIMKHFNKQIKSPYLDLSLVLSSLSLSREYLHEKKILRDILQNEFKINKKYYTRPKKAAQYGTKSMKLLNSLSNEKDTSSHLFKIHKKKNIKLGALYTGGKDGAYALYLMKKRNYEIGCLISIRSKNEDSYMFHTPEIDKVKEHAERMKIPLILIDSEGKKEEELKELKEAVKKAKENYNIEGVITGALYSEYQRQRIEKICDEVGLRIFSPLWHINQETHMHNLLKNGFKFIFTKVAAEGLNNSWLNREITEKDIDELIKLNKKYGVNVAGEGGEFETLVINCPLFK